MNEARGDWMLLGRVCLWRWAWCLAIVAGVVPARGADDDDDEPRYVAGLVATYTDAAGHAVARLDDDLHFAWHGARPDEQLAPGAWSARWQGRLFTIAAGKYQLHLHVAGYVRLKLNDRVLLETTASRPMWIATAPIELRYGYHPLELDYRPSEGTAELGLYWSGPQFQLEPVPDRHLFHDPGRTPDKSFEQGALLVRALRCEACHVLPGQRPAPLAAAALARVRGNMHAAWFVEQWLRTPVQPEAGVPGGELRRRMPHFLLTNDEAVAIAAYLHDASRESPRPADFDPRSVAPPKASKKSNGKKKVDQETPRTQPSAAAGERLLNTLGCLACHRVGARGTLGLFGGGDLTRIADKRPREFFARWLDDPATVNEAHRMPVFKLAPLERADLIEYLVTLGTEAPPAPPVPHAAASDDGRRLVREHRCGACHQLPGEAGLAKVERTPLSATSRWDRSCLEAPHIDARRPGYALSEGQRASIRAYISGVVPRGRDEPLTPDGKFVLAERNCLACHARGLSPGIAASLSAVVQADENLLPLLATLSPPALTGVGDKLHDGALESAILLKHEPLRPWLGIRMPKFPLADAEMQAIKTYLIEHDRIPELPTVERPRPEATAWQLAGARLVTSDGFGCTSCHKLGHSEPTKVAIGAMGTDLSTLGARIRRPWYDRWVRNPARIIPRMEMPAIQLPVRGVLDEHLPDQLAAVWDALNTPGFEPPLPNPVRVVRARNTPEANERAAVLTDVLELGETVYLRPVLVGLPNRHNVLFDLETNRLAASWVGDTARQRTRGKAWYWEAGAPPLGAHAATASELEITRGGRALVAVTDGQFLATLDSFEHTRRGVRFAYRVRFAPDERSAATASLRVVQSVEPLDTEPATRRTGFERRLEIAGLAPGDRLTVRSFDADGATTNVVHVADERGTARHEERHEFALAVDQFPVVLPALPGGAPQKLDVVPGYDAVRLPLPADEMPTALAWRPDGTLAIASLKGRVHLARDTDGDGLEDALGVFSDDLPAPYGLATSGEAIDVAAKFGVVRLLDADRDGFAERSEVVADGWGYTADYHDWAVGLPRDRDGNYVVALPCQQDNRSEPAARFRGQGLKLVPRPSTPDDPRGYRLEPFCGGLRFPMGLAFNRAGDLFATDNQGNYNPFNELNHLVPGARYGFINKLEVRPGFAPPLREPAVNLPHPWSRSVNGICFLETPEPLRTRLGRDLFGPHEGHLLGCEFNGRSLLRISLERVAGEYQGAAYPFSITPPVDAATFEGPLSIAVAPDGDVYIGNLLDSGWGGGQNTGSIVRLVPRGPLPPGLAEMRATPRGFELDFTAPLDADEARRASNYALRSFRRMSTPAYGGDDVDEQPAKIRGVALSADARRVTLTLDTLRAGYVYELRLGNLAVGGAALFPAEAYYTLTHVPK